MRSILRGSFSAAHFYHQSQWSPEKNKTEFGKCDTPFGHGHDYQVELTLEGELLLGQEIFSGVLEELDHQHLNFVVPEFQSLIPTTENLALYIQKRLLEKLEQQNSSFQILKLRLFETSELWVEINV